MAKLAKEKDKPILEWISFAGESADMNFGDGLGIWRPGATG